MTLTEPQLQHYYAEGFAVGGRILDNGELGRLGTEIDDLLENLPTGRRPENLPSVHYENEHFCDLFLSHPRSRTDMSCRHVYLDLELN